MALKAKGDGDESDRHERAKRALDAYAKHAGEYLDRVSVLVKDGTGLASTLLEGRAPAEACISDLAALSINALSTLCCCYEHGGDDGGEGKSTTERVVTGNSDLPPQIEMVFDVRSETAGPLELPAAALTWIDATDLVGPAGIIPSQRILVRTFDAGVMISLCDLRSVAPGTYSGTLTFTDAADEAIVRRLVVQCRDELWRGPVSV